MEKTSTSVSWQSDLSLMDILAQVLFKQSSTGQLTVVNEPPFEAAPLIFIGITKSGRIVRYGSGLKDTSVQKIESILSAKSELEIKELADCLQDDDSVRGYFLTILVALYIRYRILNILRDRRVNGKLSVNEVLTELSRVYLITMGARRVLSEITKKAGDIGELLGMNLFPKILRS